MEWNAVGTLAGLLFMMPAAVAAQTDGLAGPVVVIRTYNSFGVPTEDLLAARAEAQATLREAGVDVSWLDCGFRHGQAPEAPRGCGEPLGGNDLVLRLQAGAGSGLTRFVSMGFSLVSTGAGAAYLSTVFPDVVASVARSAAIESNHLLGLAIAHEIGHLLLNTNSHASAGLMRADWSRRAMHRNLESDWRFLSSETAAMREAVVRRASGN